MRTSSHSDTRRVVEGAIVGRFRLMGIYVAIVVVVLGCAIVGIAILRTAAAH